MFGSGWFADGSERRGTSPAAHLTLLHLFYDFLMVVLSCCLSHCSYGKPLWVLERGELKGITIICYTQKVMSATAKFLMLPLWILLTMGPKNLMTVYQKNGRGRLKRLFYHEFLNSSFQSLSRWEILESDCDIVPKMSISFFCFFYRICLEHSLGILL